jgi:ABC-type sugar transport system permease subunit
LFKRYALLAGVGISTVALAIAHATPHYFPFANDLLRWSPFLMLLTLGALAAIPQELHEAAQIDRAGTWFELGNVTMPLIAPLLLGGIVFRAIDTFAAPRPFAFVPLAYGVLAAGIALGEIAARVRRGAWR